VSIEAASGARTHLIALVGPPNSGKSTLFNRLTGLRQKVANYPGVTVERRIGRARVDESHEVSLIDLPGIYNLDPTTEDERVTHDVLTGKMADVPRPDAILLILDSTNLARNLSLAAPILALKLPTLLVLNMADDLESRGGAVDTKLLAAQLGTPVVLISAATGQGVELVTEFLSQKALLPRPVELPVLQSVPQCREWAAKIGHEAKYRAPAPPVWTRRLDRLFLHPLLGPLVFLIVVGAVFQSIFHWAEPAMQGLEALIGLAAKGLEA
jgi:ferrous iron transport protein B